MTGKGNIVSSRRHSVGVSTYVIEQFLGLGSGKHDGEEAMLATGTLDVAAGRIADAVQGGRPLDAAAAAAILARVHARQHAVGYTSSYREWLERVTAPGLA